MTNYVTLNGNTYSDGASDEGLGIRYLDNGGHWNYLIPMFSDVVTTAGNVATIGSQVAAVASATSATSLAIAIASKTFITAASVVGFAVGNYVRVQSRANTANFMYGKITAYSGTSLTVDVQVIGGSGTFADWDIWLAGMRGASGSADTTAITGILKGNGTVTSQAIPGTDYLSPTAPALSAETFSTAATITAGTNAQGQGAMTSDHNVITTAAANPSGVTLPTATVGRRIVIVNKGANPINVYPATGGTIDALAINTSIQIPVAGMMMFYASSTTQWYSTANLRLPNEQALITATGLLKGAGAGSVSAAVAGTDYQAAVTATGLLKGAGAGSVSAAVAGTDIKTVNGFSLIGSGNVATGSRSFTATGTISAAGIAVALRNDGTVSAIAGNLSSDVAFNSQVTRYIKADYSPSAGAILVAFIDETALTTKVVAGTISGNAITFGTPVTFYGTNAISIDVKQQNLSSKFVVLIGLNSGNPRVGVCSVSGTTVSVGSLTTLATTTASNVALAYDSTNDKFVAATSQSSASNYANSYVLTVSGTSLSASSNVSFHATSAQSTHMAATFDTLNNKIVLFYNRSDVVYSVVGSISGTTVTWGTEVTCYSGRGYYLSACYDSYNGKTALAFVNTATDSQCRVIIGTVSGTSITFGTAVVASANSTISVGIVFDRTNNKILLTYGFNESPQYVKAVAGAVSGTSITFGSAVNISASGYSAQDALSIAYDSGTNSALVAYRGVSNYGYGRVSSMSSGDFNLGLTNFIGISEASTTNGQAVTITTLGGVNTNVSGLSPGSKYYVDSAGALTTSSVSGVEAGKSLSATSLLVTGG